MRAFAWIGGTRRESLKPTPQCVPAEHVPQRVLLTGAAGCVAAQLLPLLTLRAWQWRLTDACDTIPPEFGEVRVLQLGAGRHSDRLFEDVDAVVHLSGQAKPAPPELLRQRNIEVMDWLLEEMRAVGIRRLVHASSMHVVGGYRRNQPVTPNVEPRPSDAYGSSKLQAERLIHAAAESWGLQALVLRLGHVTPFVSDAEPGNWLASDDLARLVSIGLHRALTGVTTVHAVTPHRGDDMGQAAIAAQLGMTWRSDAPSYRESMQRISAWYRDDATACELRGGVFASGRA